MKTVRRADCQKMATGFYTAEASSLGFRPGEWPAMFVWYENKVLGINNREFNKCKDIWRNDDLLAVQYVEPISGTILEIAND